MSEAIDEIVWARLETEFNLPSLEDVQARTAALHHEPKPAMRQLVRIFVRDGTYCPGFQFRPDGSLHPAVIDLSERARALRIPHNFFAAWMITPLGRNGVRPVDVLDRSKQLDAGLDAFARSITRSGTALVAHQTKETPMADRLPTFDNRESFGDRLRSLCGSPRKSSSEATFGSPSARSRSSRDRSYPVTAGYRVILLSRKLFETPAQTSNRTLRQPWGRPVRRL